MGVDLQPYEAGSPVSAEDFGGHPRDSPVSSNEEVSRGSWNNGRRPRTPPGDPPPPAPPGPGPRTPPMSMGPRTPEGRGARTPETPIEDRYKSRDVKRPSTPPEPYPEPPDRKMPIDQHGRCLNHGEIWANFHQ